MQLRNLESTSNEKHDDALAFSSSFRFRFEKSVEVYVQSFRGLPLRIRTQNEWGQFDCMLPEHFQEAAEDVMRETQESDQDMCWFLYGYRHGLLEEVAQLVTREIAATIDESQLESWKHKALNYQHSTSSVSLLRHYLRNHPTSFQHVRPKEALFQTGSFNALHEQSQELDAVPHQTGAHTAFKVAAGHANRLDQEHFDHIEDASSFASMIKAMNSPSQTLRQTAYQYFLTQCQNRCDVYIPRRSRKK